MPHIGDLQEMYSFLTLQDFYRFLHEIQEKDVKPWVMCS